MPATPPPIFAPTLSAHGAAMPAIGYGTMLFPEPERAAGLIVACHVPLARGQVLVDAALGFAASLAGKSFHVRMTRRGFKHEVSSQMEEQFLDHALLEVLRQRGAPGRISFDDPDAVIELETIDGRAGMSLWTRDDLRAFPFLRVD